ncbi:AfsR/SARP family transcriptional regulator [Micromonospora rifamycinica]|uniref:DNA-binding transcriptional activator of the SARP family n=1 Tax=Micromonospora rifamycinica TaxID=291594 RepID=A0A109IIW8_9ACTN|nr:AfsR/SARP family transcriptional regulator [Micromonospora rifamycinica]KWV31410.1 transcriptional regulator [Micromonospora rifamycinica]SCG78431.1 DNA-binding transcriptional activator of the SARP family [Micromonospora rifamycinica]
MSEPLRFQVLGPQLAWCGERLVDLGPGKQRAVLAVLLLSAGRPVPTFQMIDAVWPEDPPANGPNVVQKYVAGLRRVLEPERSPRAPGQVITRTDAGYLLRVDPAAVDAFRFERGVRQAEQHRAAGRTGEAAAELRAALELWHGEPFGGLTGPVLEAARQRLVEIRAGALESWAELRLDQGRHRELVGELVELVAEFPVRERLRHQFMLALYRSGRQAEALAAYREIDDLLREEHGIEPGEALRDLHRRILRADPALTPPAARSTDPSGTEAPGTDPSGTDPSGTESPGPGGDGACDVGGGRAGWPAARAEEPLPPAPVPPVADGRPAGSTPASWAAAPPLPGPSPLPPPFALRPPHLDTPHRRRPGPRDPVPRWMSNTATAVGTALVLLSFGCVTWLVILGYAIWRRSWRLAVAGVGYLAATSWLVYDIARFDPAVEGPGWQAFLGLSLVLLCWPVGAGHVLLLSRRVWGAITNRAAGLQLRAEEQRVRREQARYLLHHYPASRYQFAIGRPDLFRTFDDGGLIDVNAVADQVLLTLAGLTERQGRQVAMDRWLRGPYGSMEELAGRCALPLARTEALRDVLVFLPPGVPASTPPDRPVPTADG